MSFCFKAIAIGTANVGKTSLLNRINSGTFNSLTTATATASSLFTKDYTETDTRFTVSYWDTAGQEKYKSLGSLFYQGSCFAIAIFDITKPKSFDEMMEYIKKFSEISSISSNNSVHNARSVTSTFSLAESANIAVAANKVDQLTEEDDDLIDHYNSLLFSDSNEFKHKISCMIPTSALNGTGVNDLENQVKDWIYTNMVQPEKEDNEQNIFISDPVNFHESSQNCC